MRGALDKAIQTRMRNFATIVDTIEDLRRPQQQYPGLVRQRGRLTRHGRRGSFARRQAEKVFKHLLWLGGHSLRERTAQRAASGKRSTYGIHISTPFTWFNGCTDRRNCFKRVNALLKRCRRNVR